MTKDEAMNLALEALSFGLHVGFDESSESQTKKCGKAFDQHNKAITALRQALEQADTVTLTQTNVGIGERAMEAYEAAKQRGWSGVSDERLMKMPDELVAWRNAALRVGEDLCSVGPFGYYDMTAEQWLNWALGVVTVHAPARPQPAAWVGLTDEEMDEAMDYWSEDCRSAYGGAYAADGEYVSMISTWRYIEAKLRSKNT